MSEPEVMDELVVKKHIKMSSEAGKIDAHCSNNSIGVWVTGTNSGPDVDQISLVVQRGRGPFVALWPKRNYFTGTRRMPFALSSEGLQVPHPDGSVTILPLEKLAMLVKKLAE
jgi:hypothetical protein